MGFTWNKIAAGCYQCRENGKIVATVERIKDHGEPTWELAVFDGTVIAAGRPERKLFTYCTLGDAKGAYGFRRRMMKEGWA